MTEPTTTELLRLVLGADERELVALGRGLARALPAVTLVPAFGLRALPGAVRMSVALVLAASVAPALRTSGAPVAPGALGLLVDAARGVPIALAAAVPLWAATMAGGAIDAARGASEGAPFATLEGRPTLLGTLHGLAAGAIFLAMGGPGRVALAIADAPSELATPFAAAARDVAAGIGLAVGIAAPVLGAAIVVEVAAALVARTAAPAHVQTLLAPLRSLALLGASALVLDRSLAALARAMAGP